MRKQTKAYLFALSAILFWSTVATAFKISLRYYDYVQLLMLATATSIIIFLVITIVECKWNLFVSQSTKDILNSALLGFLSPFAYYTVLLKAYSLLPAQVAQPLNYTWPVVLVLLSAPLLKQRLTWIKVIAALVSFAGVFMIATEGNLSEFRIKQPLGFTLAVSSSVIWALFWLFNVRDKRDEIIKLLTNFIFGFVYILIYVVFFGSFDFPVDYHLLAPVYVGFFELGFSFFLWMKALQLTEHTSKISNLVFLSPFLSLVFIALILGENIYYTTIIGLVLIVAGIIIERSGK